jgi:hypothetical protein
MSKRTKSAELPNDRRKKSKPRFAEPLREKHDYEIGYGRAPKHTRFKPGVSGNPKGRPKGIRNFKTDVKATLEARVRIKGEKVQTISTRKAALLRLREKALHGDARSLDRLIALAQAYDDDEVIAAENRPADDARLLEFYQRRLVRGAAEWFGDDDDAAD